jgi:hypothetical protein
MKFHIGNAVVLGSVGATGMQLRFMRTVAISIPNKPEYNAPFQLSQGPADDKGGRYLYMKFSILYSSTN